MHFHIYKNRSPDTKITLLLDEVPAENFWDDLKKGLGAKLASREDAEKLTFSHGDSEKSQMLEITATDREARELLIEILKKDKGFNKGEEQNQIELLAMRNKLKASKTKDRLGAAGKKSKNKQRLRRQLETLQKNTELLQKSVAQAVKDNAAVDFHLEEIVEREVCRQAKEQAHEELRGQGLNRDSVERTKQERSTAPEGYHLGEIWEKVEDVYNKNKRGGDTSSEGGKTPVQKLLNLHKLATIAQVNMVLRKVQRKHKEKIRKKEQANEFVSGLMGVIDETFEKKNNGRRNNRYNQMSRQKAKEELLAFLKNNIKSVAEFETFIGDTGSLQSAKSQQAPRFTFGRSQTDYIKAALGKCFSRQESESDRSAFDLMNNYSGISSGDSGVEKIAKFVRENKRDFDREHLLQAVEAVESEANQQDVAMENVPSPLSREANLLPLGSDGKHSLGNRIKTEATEPGDTDGHVAADTRLSSLSLKRDTQESVEAHDDKVVVASDDHEVKCFVGGIEEKLDKLILRILKECEDKLTSIGIEEIKNRKDLYEKLCENTYPNDLYAQMLAEFLEPYNRRQNGDTRSYTTERLQRIFRKKSRS